MAIERKSVEEMKQPQDLKDIAGLKNAILELIAEKGENLKIDGLDKMCGIIIMKTLDTGKNYESVATVDCRGNPVHRPISTHHGTAVLSNGDT